MSICRIVGTKTALVTRSGLELVEHRRGVELAHEDRGRALGEPEVGPGDPADVEHRQRRQAHGSRRRRTTSATLKVARLEVAVRRQHALGDAGRPGRVHLQYRVVGLAAPARVDGVGAASQASYSSPTPTTVSGCGTAAATVAATSMNSGPAISTGAPASVTTAASSGAASRQFKGTATAPSFAAAAQQLDHLRARCGPGARPATPAPAPASEQRLGEPVRALVELRVGQRALAVADRDGLPGRSAAMLADRRPPRAPRQVTHPGTTARPRAARRRRRASTPASVEATERSGSTRTTLATVSCRFEASLDAGLVAVEARPRTPPHGASAALTRRRAPGPRRRAASQLVGDAGGGHRRELRLDVVGEHEQIADLDRCDRARGRRAAPRARSRAPGTCAISASWSAITSTTSLASPSSTGIVHGVARQRAAEAVPAVLGIDDEAHLADVARPARAAARPRPEPTTSPRRWRSRARCPGRAHAVTTAGSSTSSLRNVRSASGMRAKKRTRAASSSAVIGRNSIRNSFAAGSSSECLDDPAGKAGHRVLDRAAAGAERDVPAGQAQLLAPRRIADQVS